MHLLNDVHALRDYLAANRHALVTAAPVIVETCFFLDADAKGRLLEWVGRGALGVADVPVAAYADLNAILRKYANRNIDFADAALVWLAASTGMRGILTVDEADFSLFRLPSGKRFDLLRWYR